MGKVKCPVCGTLIDDDPYGYACPLCGWVYTGCEECYEPDETEDYNLISINEAKALLKAGKNKWGKPLPKI